MKLYITNAFSLNMVPHNPTDTVRQDFWAGLATGKEILFQPVTLEQAKELLSREKNEKTIISAVGHPDTARVFSNLLGRKIPYCRMDVEFVPGVTLLVGQYTGPRLREGATELPEGAILRWWSVAYNNA